jgi:hypothetical protein
MQKSVIPHQGTVHLDEPVSIYNNAAHIIAVIMGEQLARDMRKLQPGTDDAEHFSPMFNSVVEPDSLSLHEMVYIHTQNIWLV